MDKLIQKLGVLMFVALLVFVGCGGETLPQIPEFPTKLDDSQANDEMIQELVAGNNQFAFELYGNFVGQTAENSDSSGNADSEGAAENLFFSPYSISTALGMTYEGANGQTAEEMANVFHFPEDQETRFAANAYLYNLLNNPENEFQLQTANALWVEETFELLDEYTSNILNYYGGFLVNLDFQNASKEAVEIINSWVAEQTEDRIQNVVSESSVNEQTRLVLTNTIYFNADWRWEFDANNTMDREFTLDSGEKVEVPTMHEWGYSDYYEDENLQMIKKDYMGGDVSMFVLLPQEGRMSEMESQMNSENFATWQDGLENLEVRERLPKFEFETSYSLVENFMNMGIEEAFTGNADFSGITGIKDLFIGAVIHKTFVKVDEKGTEAAAVTVVEMDLTSAEFEEEEKPEPKLFYVDRPFVFVIQENTTGQILFLGKVMDPRG